MSAKKITQFVLFVAALGFFVYYGAQNWTEVRAVVVDFDPILIIIAMVLVIASLSCKALMNVYLLKELLHTPVGNVTLFHSYTQAQIVKYIPGKIWGILFQASSLEGNIRKSDVWVVNVLQMMMANAFSLAILMATIIFIESLSPLIKTIVVGGGIVSMALVYFNFGRMLRWFKVDEATLKKYAAFIDASLVRRIVLIMLFDWLFYIGMWGALSYGQLSFFAAFVTAVNYTTASIVGWLVFVVPSGLVVREAVFVAFGQIIGENLSVLIAYSVVARVLFLAGDMLLYLLTLVFRKVNARSKRALGTDG